VTNFNEDRAAVLELARRAATLAQERREPSLAAEFDAAGERLREGTLTVVVVGEFKRGKSTLLNALLEETDVFPPNESVATSLVTTASWGDPARFTVLLESRADDGTSATREITRGEIGDYVTEQGNPGNEREAVMLTAELPNENLRDGLVLVDTPGVGGLNRRHTDVTYRFVTQADVVLFVIDAMVPASSEELAFLERIREHCRALLFVVTKKDLQRDHQRIVENTRAKVAPILGELPDRVTVVAVSSTAKLRYVESGAERDLEKSNFGELEDKLWGLLAERGGALLLLRALGVLARGIDRLISPLEAELQAYEQGSRQGLEQMEAELQQALDGQEHLRQSEAAWRNDLRRELNRTSRILDERFSKGARGVRHTLVTALEDDQLLRAPEEILGALERDVTLLADTLSKTLEAEVERIAAAIAKSTVLELAAAGPTGLIATDVVVAKVDGITSAGVRGESLLAAGRGLSMGVSAGAIIGFIIGTVIAPGIGSQIGSTIGGLLGGTQGARSQLKQLREHDRNKLRGDIQRRLSPWIEDAVGHINDQRREALEDTRTAVEDAFDDMLASERKRLAATIAAVTAARGRSEDEAAERAKEIRLPLAGLREVRAAVDAHTQAVVTGGETSPGVDAEPAPARPLEHSRAAT
jgi:ribosome biogenesis GTPase A/gas vesicle protein